MGAIESKVLIQYKKTAAAFPINLSEEQLVDCFSRNGCEGGWPMEAYDWIAKASKGLAQEGHYPVRLGWLAC